MVLPLVLYRVAMKMFPYWSFSYKHVCSLCVSGCFVHLYTEVFLGIESIYLTLDLLHANCCLSRPFAHEAFLPLIPWKWGWGDLDGNRAEVQTTLPYEGKLTVNAFWVLNYDRHAFILSQFYGLNPVVLSFFFFFFNIAMKAWVAGREPSTYARMFLTVLRAVCFGAWWVDCVTVRLFSCVYCSDLRRLY